jgi:hypothetical protein
MGYRNVESPGSIPVFTDHRCQLDEPTSTALAIDYLHEENRILREQLAGRRLRFTDDQRRRLATKAKGSGRKLLAEFAWVK